MSLARITNNVVSYLHNDHLGSSASATNSSGTVLWTQHYTPFGETWNDIAANDNQAGFTGHIKDTATGLNYMQARYYDPIIGRFLSIDPLTFLDTGEPGYFNRYAYAFNNPINNFDPNGMECKSLGDGCTFGPRDPETGEFTYKEQPQLSSETVEGMNAVVPALMLATGNTGTPGATASSNAGGVMQRAAKASDPSVATRANEIQQAAGAARQGRTTTAVAQTAEGTRVVALSEPALRSAQTAALRTGEVAVRGVGHAEVTAVNGARALGLTPTGVAASRPICTQCSTFLKKQNVQPLTPLK